jgi:hypothetical protein
VIRRITGASQAVAKREVEYLLEQLQGKADEKNTEL